MTSLPLADILGTRHSRLPGNCLHPSIIGTYRGSHPPRYRLGVPSPEGSRSWHPPYGMSLENRKLLITAEFELFLPKFLAVMSSSSSNLHLHLRRFQNRIGFILYTEHIEGSPESEVMLPYCLHCWKWILFTSFFKETYVFVGYIV